MRRVLVFLAFMVFAPAWGQSPAVAMSYKYWTLHTVSQGEWLYELMRGLEKKGLPIYSMSDLKHQIIKRNSHIKDINKLEVGDEILLPYFEPPKTVARAPQSVKSQRDKNKVHLSIGASHTRMDARSLTDGSQAGLSSGHNLDGVASYQRLLLGDWGLKASGAVRRQEFDDPNSSSSITGAPEMFLSGGLDVIWVPGSLSLSLGGNWAEYPYMYTSSGSFSVEKIGQIEARFAISYEVISSDLVNLTVVAPVSYVMEASGSVVTAESGLRYGLDLELDSDILGPTLGVGLGYSSLSNKTNITEQQFQEAQLKVFWLYSF